MTSENEMMRKILQMMDTGAERRISCRVILHMTTNEDVTVTVKESCRLSHQDGYHCVAVID